MKKTLLLLLPFFLLVSTITLFGNEISLAEAERLVPTVIKRNARPSLANARNLNISERYTKEVAGKANFHIFNLSPTGFVIIAGDDRYNAVLAFSDESNIDLTNKEKYVGLYGTLSSHEARIAYIREKNVSASIAVQNEWKTLRSGNTATSRQAIVVAPLTTTLWNQGTYYNAECPADEDSAENGPDGRTYCGCAPIAMAQLIKFHNSPILGNGSNSYIDPIYGEQTADFCSTEYNWSNMPDELTAPNADVAKLIYHMGVSTFTHYSTDYTATYVSYIRDAFVDYFGFDQSANWFYDANGDFNWVARNDLDRGRPTLLSGESLNGGAHTWVADGYGYFDASGGEGNTEYFHFNWGWGGDNNGWFLDSDESWFPRGDEPNNVEISYYFNRYVIQNLFPASESCQSPDDFYASGAREDDIYLNVYYPSGDQDISFRYRKLGETEWTTTPVTTEYYYLAKNLERATEYEFQARRKCCPTDWSAYSASETFTTAGFVPCVPLAASGMSVDVLSDTRAYIYTARPFGKTLNQFKYRPVGTTEWSFTDITDSHYRLVSELLAGTEYEVQVTQLCSNGDYSQYSDSFMFTTTGEAVDGGDDDNGSTDGGGDDDGNSGDNNCAPAEGADMTTSSISDNNSYIYTPQPNGRDKNNQFRYRKVGSSDWMVTDISNSYYRYLRDLSPGTTYEFANRQECSTDVWSGYSDAQEFTTTGEAADDDGNDDTNDDDDTTDGGNTDDDGENDDGDGEGTSNDCTASDGDKMTTSSISDNSGYIYTQQPHGRDKNNQFRYRKVGESEWIRTDISTSYYRYLRDLSPGTTYEFANRQECSTDVWSDYSNVQEFTTTGEAVDNGDDDTDNGNTDNGGGSDYEHSGSGTCEGVDASKMYTSSVGANNAYIYTPRPLGVIPNQFRYRPVGFTDWADTGESTSHYRYLSNLTPGTQYEFQTRHGCSIESWSSYSESVYFTTTGSTNSSKINTSIPKPLTVENLASLNPTAYGNQLNLSVTLFPNPTSNQLFLKTNTTFERGDRITVIDRIGRIVKDRILNEGTQRVELRVGELEDGIYMIQLQTRNAIQVKKFIKQ